jgi:hypothetical protein
LLTQLGITSGEYAKCRGGRRAQWLRYLGIEVDDAIEIAKKIDI